jgi:hypothetical protein
MSAEDMAKELERRGATFVLLMSEPEGPREGLYIYRAGGVFNALGLIDRGRHIVHEMFGNETGGSTPGWGTET